MPIDLTKRVPRGDRDAMPDRSHDRSETRIAETPPGVRDCVYQPYVRTQPVVNPSAG